MLKPSFQMTKPSSTSTEPEHRSLRGDTFLMEPNHLPKNRALGSTVSWLKLRGPRLPRAVARLPHAVARLPFDTFMACLSWFVGFRVLKTGLHNFGFGHARNPGAQPLNLGAQSQNLGAQPPKYEAQPNKLRAQPQNPEAQIIPGPNP